MNSEVAVATSATGKVAYIKPYSLSELANLYGVSSRTMKNWISPHSLIVGDKIGRLYTTLQVQIIFNKLGLP